jgi:hypothetical protein
MALLNFQTRKKIQALAQRWHDRVLWLSAIAVFIWGCSGALHPIMAKLGPSPAKTLPPPTLIDTQAIKFLPQVLEQFAGKSVERVRWISTPVGLAIQISETGNPSRHYFLAKDGSALPYYMDEIYAAALARHFTGNVKNGVREITLLTGFSEDYPWVNRLLPVYRIQFANAQNTTAYIHTETSSLAALSNDRKEQIQTLFSKLHTLNFLDEQPWLRIPIALLFVGALGFSAMSGLQMIFSIKRKPPTASRWWHRQLGIICCVPLLCFSLSGIHHLLQMSSTAGLRGKTSINSVSLPADFSAETFANTINHAFAALPANQWRDISLVQNDTQLLLRLAEMPNATQHSTSAMSASGGEHAHHDSGREQRFNGIPQEGVISYIDLSGQHVHWQDEQQARHIAHSALQISDENIAAVKPLTHFSATYDFRNKRLPVWEMRLKDTEAKIAYIDTSSNRVIEALGNSDIYEVWNFSMLHKWNFLVFPIGRPARDALVLVAIALSVLLTAAGIIVRFRKKTAAK